MALDIGIGGERADCDGGGRHGDVVQMEFGEIDEAAGAELIGLEEHHDVGSTGNGLVAIGAQSERFFE